MSATFLRLKVGGFVNAAHVQLITDEDVAIVFDPSTGEDLSLELFPNWNSPVNVINVGEV